MKRKKMSVDAMHPDLSIMRQCELLGLSRSSLYKKPEAAIETGENIELMKLIDGQFLKTPFYSSHRITAWLQKQGYGVNRKRVQRLMRIMNIEGIAPGPKTSKPKPEHEIYPYLLRKLDINKPDQVWSTDITFLPMDCVFMYLVAVIDWYSRYILSWELSNTLDADFCVSALKRALAVAKPEIFNTDQGSQFTSKGFLAPLKAEEISISMDGRGRALDNIFVERFWRTVKYEWLYLNDYDTVKNLSRGLHNYLEFYNNERLHSSLDYQTPYEIYFQNKSFIAV